MQLTMRRCSTSSPLTEHSFSHGPQPEVSILKETGTGVGDGVGSRLGIAEGWAVVGGREGIQEGEGVVGELVQALSLQV